MPAFVSFWRILIADDHEVARRGIRSLLETRAGWEVCGEARDGREAVECANKMKLDLVLLDLGMPRLNGLDAARQILATYPEIRILILPCTILNRCSGKCCPLERGVSC